MTARRTMAKQLSLSQIQSIITLHRSGHSNRKIAELLGIHRQEAKHLDSTAAVPAKPDPRELAAETSKR